MQYFSVIAYVDDKPGRTCAMLQGATLEAAATKARSLIRAEHLNFVERRARFAVRRASRRETSLLQSYLASCGLARLHGYRKEDLDALLWRRGGLLLSFFMALYLKPETLYRRFSPLPAGSSHTASGSGGGSGGKEIGSAVQASEVLVAEGGGQATSNLDEPESVQTEELMAESSTEGLVGDDNQISALEDIVNGPASDEKEVDLGDIF